LNSHTKASSRTSNPSISALAAGDTDGHTALEEQLLDVAQTQLKEEIPAHSATDDLGWETMTVIERFRFLHHAILRDRPNNLTTPFYFTH
jgi:hypothetical protein